MLGTNGYKASRKIGCMAARKGDHHPAVLQKMELPSIGTQLVEFCFRGESLENPLPLTFFSDMSANS